MGQTIDFTQDSLGNENTLSLEDVAELTQKSTITNDSKFELMHSKTVSHEYNNSRSIEPQGCSYSEIQHMYDGSN